MLSSSTTSARPVSSTSRSWSSVSTSISILTRWPAWPRARSSTARDAAGDRDVVVLDQDRVVEAEAVVEAAAAAHGVFLQRAQARRGLARAADARVGACGAAHVIGRQRGDAGQAADEIQRGALADEHGARRARRSSAACCPAATAAPSRACGLDADVGRRACCNVATASGRPAIDAGLPRHHDGAAPCVRFRNGRDRGDVAGAAEIFVERARARPRRSQAARGRRRDRAGRRA